MGNLKKLERFEKAGWQLLHARYYHVLRPLASHTSHILQGGQETQLGQSSVVVGQHTQKSHHNGWLCHAINRTFKAKAGGKFGSHKLDVSLTVSTGSFLPDIKEFSGTRGFATHDDFDEEELSEIETSNASVSDSDGMDVPFSDKDTIDKTVSKQRQKQVRTPSSAQCPDDPDEEDDYGDEILNSDLMVSSPLDAASETAMEETCDQRRPLWLRLEEASAGKKPFLIKDVFDEWTVEGNTLSRAVIIYTITILRKRRKFWRALEVSDWVMRERPFELTDMDFGVRVALIAKLQGAKKAADYFATIPKAFQTSMVYSILLTAYVEQNKEKEAVSLLQKVEKLGLGHRTYMYNQLLYLYKKNGLMAGVAEVLKTIEEKNVEPNVFTYNIILDVRARKGDVSGMEKVWAHIEDDENVEPDAATFAILAKGYLNAGLPEKAEQMAEKMEQSTFRRRQFVNLLLLKLYGNLGKEDQLERVWGLVKAGPRVGNADYITMLRALGKVGNSPRAEDIFEEMEEKLGSPTLRHYNALLSVYASLGRTQRGENLLKKLAKAKLHPNPETYHQLVLMYLKAGQEDKALGVLSTARKASQTSVRMRPLYATFHAVLEWLADKGDVKGAEKVVRDLKSAGYWCSYRSYLVLLKAYENGHMSPYGFLDRLKADNVFVNQHIRKQLKILDGT